MSTELFKASRKTGVNFMLEENGFRQGTKRSVNFILRSMQRSGYVFDDWILMTV